MFIIQTLNSYLGILNTTKERRVDLFYIIVKYLIIKHLVTGKIPTMIARTCILKLVDLLLLNTCSVNSSSLYNDKAGILLRLFETARIMKTQYAEERTFRLFHTRRVTNILFIWTLQKYFFDHMHYCILSSYLWSRWHNYYRKYLLLNLHIPWSFFFVHWHFFVFR